MSRVHPRRVDQRAGADGEALAAVVAKRYWTKGDARVVVEAWEASGQPAGEFARSHGFGRHRLDWWRKRLRKSAAQRGATEEPRWWPVVVKPMHSGEERAAGDNDQATMEVILAVGRRIRLRPGFDAAAVQRLIATLEVEPC
jgi:hypothetical protein